MGACSGIHSAVCGRGIRQLHADHQFVLMVRSAASGRIDSALYDEIALHQRSHDRHLPERCWCMARIYAPIYMLVWADTYSSRDAWADDCGGQGVEIRDAQVGSSARNAKQCLRNGLRLPEHRQEETFANENRAGEVQHSAKPRPRRLGLTADDRHADTHLGRTTSMRNTRGSACAHTVPASTMMQSEARSLVAIVNAFVRPLVCTQA